MNSSGSFIKQHLKNLASHKNARVTKNLKKKKVSPKRKSKQSQSRIRKKSAYKRNVKTLKKKFQRLR